MARTSPIAAGGNYWAQQNGVWTVSSSNVNAVIGLDGISVPYSDTALFPLSGYTFQVTDSANNTTQTATADATSNFYWTGTNLVYLFKWGSEVRRTLTLTVTDEAGQSTSTTIDVEKPVWGSFTASSPTKTSGQGTFAVAWTDDGNDVTNWTKGIRWDNKSLGSSGLTNYLAEGSTGQAVLSPQAASLSVGDTLDYESVVDNANGFAPIEVQGTPTTAYIPYESVSSPALPGNLFLGAGSASQVSIAAITTTASDGTSIRYALAITAQSSNGTKTEYFPYSAQYQGFPYSLWSLFNLTSGTDASSLAALTAALQSSTLTASIVAWYGDPLGAATFIAPASTPTTGAYNSTSGPLPTVPLANPVALEQSWPLSSVGWDVTPPAVTLAGTLSNPNEITNSFAISGSATDSGGSGLKNVVVTYLSVDSSGNPIGTLGPVTVPLTPDAQGNFSYSLNTARNLNDGFYSLQVIATDNAGNQSTNAAITKLLDTAAPLVDQFQFSSTPTAGTIQASATGTVTASLTIDDGNGTGLPGSGLGAIQYQWEDALGNLLSSQPWVNAVLNPPVFPYYDTLHTGAESFAVTFDNAVNGTAYLHYKLVDKAGNASADTTAPQTVAYQGTAPNVQLTVGGWTTASGQNWIRSPSSLSVGYTPADSTQANAVATAQWNVQLVKSDGTFEDDSATWSAWGASFDAVRSLITTDGQSYRIRLKVQNVNGVTSQVLSSPVFTKDGAGPQNVTALLASTNVIAGQALRATVNGSDPYGQVTWTWSYQPIGGSAVAQSYIPGNDVVIPSVGSFLVTFTATSGSGISVPSITQSVTVAGSGLAVDDDQRYTDGAGAISGRWTYVGSTPAGYSFQWLRQSDGAVLQLWTPGDATNSSVLMLGSTGVSLQQGDVVVLDVKALDANGNVLDDEKSAGSTVDTTPPNAMLTSSPAFVAPNDVWLRFTAADPDSGIAGGTVLIKRMTQASDGSWRWAPITEQSLPSSSGQRVDLDLSGTPGVGTNDRIIAEVSMTNGAGLTSTVETGVMIVDGTPPPTPLVIPVEVAGSNLLPIVSAVNQTQQLGVNWTYTTPDPVSGTVQYFWKAYTDSQDPSTVAWTSVPATQTTVTGLTAFAGEQDGTVLYFAVMAVNGAGLTSVGYSQGIILDSLAPVINALVPENGSTLAPISTYVQQSDLGASPSLVGLFDAVDQIAGLQSFEIQAGTWSPGAGFTPLGTPVDFPALSATETSQQSQPVPFSANPGILYLIKGTAYNSAGNVTVYSSPAFEVLGAEPNIAALIGNLGPNLLSFTWTVDQNPLPSDFTGYQVALAKKDGTSLQSSLVASPAWTVDWTTLGLQDGDQVSFTVTPITQLGQGQSKTITMSIQPGPPVLGTLNYTRYFSTHFNVKQVSYAVASGVEQIQMRVLDGSTGQLVQDWTPDYSGNSASWIMPYPSADTIYDGQRLIVEVRAESQAGVWSDLTPTEVILVDETPATGVGISRASAYSNAMNKTGAIDGWSVTAEDDQSGIVAYQTLLLTASAYTALMHNPGGLSLIDWSSAPSPVPVGASPGAAWQISNGIVSGVSAMTDYYAVLRIQNGTEDWGTDVASTIVHVSWTPPAITIGFDASVFSSRDLTGNVVTNAGTETLTLSSSEKSTSFVLSVNGTTFGTTTSGDLDASGFSRGYVTLNAPGTDILSATATDLYGNQGSAEDSLRFNQPAVVAISGAGLPTKVTTTPGKPLVVEQAVNVTDDYRDYPLSYSWNLSPGTLVSFTGTDTAGCASTAAGDAPWVPGGVTTVEYFQNSPRAQSSTYGLKLTVTDAWGLSTTQAIPLEVDNTTEGKLYTNEYWTGPVLLSGMVEIPSGLSLSLDSVQAEAYGSLDPNNIMLAGIQVDSGGALRVSNSGGGSRFDTYIAGYLWKGISIAGNGTGSGLELDHAERGFTLLPGGSLSMPSLELNDNLIGIHLLGGSLSLNGGTIGGNAEYGIKEDGPGTYSVKNMVFGTNGVGYYQLGKTGISTSELNAIPGNGGNQ
jgi:hypothetical protein